MEPWFGAAEAVWLTNELSFFTQGFIAGNSKRLRAQRKIRYQVL
jgi:hypothetical protein